MSDYEEDYNEVSVQRAMILLSHSLAHELDMHYSDDDLMLHKEDAIEGLALASLLLPGMDLPAPPLVVHVLRRAREGA